MKKILYILILCLVSVFTKAQTTPYTGLTGYPINQSLGSDSAAVNSKGMLSGRIVLYRFTDTTAANLQRIKNYPFALIGTTSDNTLWMRNKYANKWERGSGSIDIDYFDFLTDSSLVICFGNGTCDTISMYHFTDVVNNLIQNFLDSSIYNINDSTLIICNGAGSCDTIHLNNSNTYNFFVSGDTTYLVTCDTIQVICVGDSCYQQQVCDTIALSAPPISPTYQNLVQKLQGTEIIEAGNSYAGANTVGDMVHDTYFNLNYHQLTLYGARQGSPPFAIDQNQWSQIGSSVTSFRHNGAYAPTYNLLDENNPVKLYVNYSDPFYKMTEGALTGDTLGFLGNEYGYMIMTNSSGFTQHYTLDDVNAKQTGIALFTYGTSNRAVGIFGNQVPSEYGLSTHPPTDSTLLDAMIAIFKTNGQQQLPQYISGAFEDPSPLYLIAQDADGNLVQYPPGGMGGTNPFENIANASLTADANYTQNWAGFRLRFDSTSFVTMNTKAGETSGQMWRAKFELDDDISFWEIRNRSTATRVETGLDLTSGTPAWYALANNYNTTKIHGIYADTTEAGIYYSSTSILSPTRYWRVTSSAVEADGLSNTTTSDVLYYNSATKEVSYGAAPSVAANNGLSIYQDTIVQLFGPLATPSTLLNDRYLTQGVFSLNMTSTNNTSGVNVTNTGGGTGITVITNGNIGVYSESTFDTGVQAEGQGYGTYSQTTSDQGVGLYASNLDNIGNAGGAIAFRAKLYGSQATVQPVIEIRRNVEGATTPSNGIGGSIDFYTETTTTPAGSISNQIISKLTVAAGATRTSQFIITGVNNAVTQNLMTLAGSGQLTLDQYTTSNFNGGAAADSVLVVTSAGVVKKRNASAFGITGITADNGLTASTATNVQLGSAAIGDAFFTTTRYISSNGHPLHIYDDVGSTPILSLEALAGTEALQVSSSGTYAIQALTDQSSTNTVVGAFRAVRHSTGTPADGMGGSIDLQLETTTTSYTLANQLIWKWTTATHATRTSQLDITGVTGGTTQTWFTFGQSGSVKFRPMTVTEAGAIATAEGLMVFVSNTDATFTSIGLWIYQNGAWKAL